jgi:hypothetical protein
MYNCYNICNILVYFCNIHMKHLQHTFKTYATLETDVCNMRFQVQHLLTYEIEARRRVEFTGGIQAIVTIDRSTLPTMRPAETPSWPWALVEGSLTTQWI